MGQSSDIKGQSIHTPPNAYKSQLHVNYTSMPAVFYPIPVMLVLVRTIAMLY